MLTSCNKLFLWSCRTQTLCLYYYCHMTTWGQTRPIQTLLSFTPETYSLHFFLCTDLRNPRPILTTEDMQTIKLMSEKYVITYRQKKSSKKEILCISSFIWWLSLWMGRVQHTLNVQYRMYTSHSYPDFVLKLPKGL